MFVKRMGTDSSQHLLYLASRLLCIVEQVVGENRSNMQNILYFNSVIKTNLGLTMK